MIDSFQPSFEVADPSFTLVNIELVLTALNEARSNELAAHRRMILTDGMTTRQRNKDPDHTFLAGHTGGYVLGISKAVELLKLAKNGSETLSTNVEATSHPTQA